MPKIKEAIPLIRKIIWAGFLLSLPITNFRYFPFNLGGSKIQVRPLLFVPMVFLLLLNLPRFWKKNLPRTYLPLFIFIIFTLVSSILPIFLGFSSQLSELSYLSHLVRTMITLFLGIAIYLTASTTPQNEADLDFTLKWLYAGLALAIFWGSLQIIFVLDLIPGWYVTLSEIQKHITINVGSPNRIMGLTLEPSWFADQISALWLPFVLPAALHNRTVFTRRWGWLTVEKILLVWMLAVLMFTLSRAGISVALVVLGAGVLFFRLKAERKLGSVHPAGIIGKITRVYEKVPTVIKYSVIGIGSLIVIGGALFILSKQSNYIFRMWDYWLRLTPLSRSEGPRSLSKFFQYVGFGPRFVFWETAFRIFQHYPFFGVGLGNYTFHFNDFLPAVQVGYLPEILMKIVPDYVRVTTAKNYFARLLAETGLFGTGAWIAYLVSMTGGGLYLWLSKDPEKKFWGAGALLGLLAFLVDSFSYDSLAIPNPWVVFGLITAAVTIFSTSNNDNARIS